MPSRLYGRRSVVTHVTMTPPAPPNPGFRQNRGGLGVHLPVFGGSGAISSVSESYASGTTDAAATSAWQTWLSAHATNNKVGLTTVGWSPEPIYDDGSIPDVPIALVNVQGELTNMSSDKAYMLKNGIPIPTDGTYVPSNTSDCPACVFDPTYSIFDVTAGRTLSRRMVDLWRLRHPGDTWGAYAGSHTATRTVNGVGITNGTAVITFASGAIAQNPDSGMTVAHAAFPANTYIISTTSTTATLSNVANTGGGNLSGQSVTLSPTNPSSLAWPVWECQNASRFLDVDNNPGWPLLRYPNQGATKPSLVENTIWKSTATGLAYLGGMMLGEDADSLINNGQLIHHAVDFSTPYQNGGQVWPAQGHDTTIHFDATSPFTEGQRFRLNFGYGETPGASMPLTDAYISSQSTWHPLLKLLCMQHARCGGKVWDTSSSAGGFSIRWDSKLSQFFGSTPYYNVMNNYPTNKIEVVRVGNDINWNP